MSEPETPKDPPDDSSPDSGLEASGDPEAPSEESGSWWGHVSLSRSSSGALGAAETLTGGLLGFGLIGYLLDLKFGTGPVLVLTGLGLALLVGFYQLYRTMFSRSGRDDSEKK